MIKVQKTGFFILIVAHAVLNFKGARGMSLSPITPFVWGVVYWKEA